MALKLLCFKYYVNYIMLTDFVRNTGLAQAGVLVFSQVFLRHSQLLLVSCRNFEVSSRNALIKTPASRL